MDIICDVRYLGIIEVSSQKSEQHEFFAVPESYCGCLKLYQNTEAIQYHLSHLSKEKENLLKYLFQNIPLFRQGQKSNNIFAIT
ncbi:hypothetical protein BpHYR1_048612 [Brachionus plicatilis]|uniref:Uncharacterized protein n=1 Tax=Brachionus plicatilis TaxID=10195 RepID=A0A3M7PQ80_BRAPC|nr:hypothetical protein BpHYR1_048612 [Brachionus plicatilis]